MKSANLANNDIIPLSNVSLNRTANHPGIPHGMPVVQVLIAALISAD